MALAELTLSAGEAALLNAFPPTEAGDAARAQIAAEGLPNRRVESRGLSRRLACSFAGPSLDFTSDKRLQWRSPCQCPRTFLLLVVLDTIEK